MTFRTDGTVDHVDMARRNLSRASHFTDDTSGIPANPTKSRTLLAVSVAASLLAIAEAVTRIADALEQEPVL